MALIFYYSIRVKQIVTYRNGVGAPVLSGSVGAMVFGSNGSGGGMISLDK